MGNECAIFLSMPVSLSYPTSYATRSMLKVVVALFGKQYWPFRACALRLSSALFSLNGRARCSGTYSWGPNNTAAPALLNSVVLLKATTDTSLLFPTVVMAGAIAAEPSVEVLLKYLRTCSALIAEATIAFVCFFSTLFSPPFFLRAASFLAKDMQLHVVCLCKQILILQLIWMMQMDLLLKIG